ncbi:hypothetical protein ACQBAR_10470 [Propionibacteriaceae bacterium Y1685]|uniref:hypothetical protein n=1 Tax=Microlunatus sp. Y1700 TaxID=3418487 RepID=UPI003B7B94D9
MPRKVNLPRTAGLFDDGRVGDEPVQVQQGTPPEELAPATAAAAEEQAPTPEVPKPQVRPTGRVRHDGKITVYLSSEELTLLEETRLALRADHGVAVDRGRIVRASVAASVEDLQARGVDSDLVARLRQS